ncbi:MAG: hypothetical protein AAFX78_02540 [Cyanobacteria bacterium J06638_20]
MSTLARITLGRLTPTGSGGTPSGVVGGFLSGVVQPSLQAAVRADPVVRAVGQNAIVGAVSQSFTASVTQPIVAAIQPDPIVARLSDGG